MTKSLSFNVKLSLCLILVPTACFGIDCWFSHSPFVLVPTTYFCTNYLFWYHLLILVLAIYLCLALIARMKHQSSKPSLQLNREWSYHSLKEYLIWRDAFTQAKKKGMGSGTHLKYSLRTQLLQARWQHLHKNRETSF